MNVAGLRSVTVLSLRIPRLRDAAICRGLNQAGRPRISCTGARTTPGGVCRGSHGRKIVPLACSQMHRLVCQSCGSTFEADRLHTKTCSPACRKRLQRRGVLFPPRNIAVTEEELRRAVELMRDGPTSDFYTLPLLCHFPVQSPESTGGFLFLLELAPHFFRNVVPVDEQIEIPDVRKF